MVDAAVIFDVDGVLLELTSAEEDAFFETFEQRYGLKNLSRNWDSYAVRNDENIVAEILERHGLPARERTEVIADYSAILQQRLSNGTIETITIPGTGHLLRKLQGTFQIGIATANFLSAAKLRLIHAGIWHHVSAQAAGAEGGGHKREILARTVALMGLPKSQLSTWAIISMTWMRAFQMGSISLVSARANRASENLRGLELFIPEVTIRKPAI